MSNAYSYSYGWDGPPDRSPSGDWIVLGEGPVAYSVQGGPPAAPASSGQVERAAGSGDRQERECAGDVWGLAYRNVFSDLGQWMGKVLLGQGLPESVVHLPREPIRNAHRLALAAEVSDASANRWVRAMERMHLLHRSRSKLVLLRPGVFLARWRAAVLSRPPFEIGAVFDEPTDAPGAALIERVRRLEPSRRHALGLYAACDALGVGIVRGVAPHLYLEDLDPAALADLGLHPAAPGQRVDVFVRRPLFPESLFRAAVRVGDLWVADALQCWLDLRDHPARGEEQADFLAQKLGLPRVES